MHIQINPLTYKHKFEVYSVMLYEAAFLLFRYESINTKVLKHHLFRLPLPDDANLIFSAMGNQNYERAK